MCSNEFFGCILKKKYCFRLLRWFLTNNFRKHTLNNRPRLRVLNVVYLLCCCCDVVIRTHSVTEITCGIRTFYRGL